MWYKPSDRSLYDCTHVSGADVARHRSGTSAACLPDGFVQDVMTRSCPGHGRVGIFALGVAMLDSCRHRISMHLREVAHAPCDAAAVVVPGRQLVPLSLRKHQGVGKGRKGGERGMRRGGGGGVQLRADGQQLFAMPGGGASE